MFDFRWIFEKVKVSSLKLFQILNATQSIWKVSKKSKNTTLQIFQFRKLLFKKITQSKNNGVSIQKTDQKSSSKSRSKKSRSKKCLSMVERISKKQRGPDSKRQIKKRRVCRKSIRKSMKLQHSKNSKIRLNLKLNFNLKDFLHLKRTGQIL